MSIEAIKKALEGVTPDRVERLWWFLHILSNSSGSTNADDDEWNWINAFCTDYEDDTFNRAYKLGFIKVSHDSIMETSTARMTPAGFSFVNYFEKAPSASLISEIDRLQRENGALREDRYKLACAIIGGEDAPGLLDSTPTSEIVEIAQHAHRMHQGDIDRAMAAEAEVARLQTELALSKPLYSRRQIQARVKLLEEALKPFAEEAENWSDSVPDDHKTLCTEPGSSTAHPGSEAYFTVGDLRRARDTLASTGGEHHAE